MKLTITGTPIAIVFVTSPIVLLFLKVLNIIDCHWIWVWAPWWVPVGLYLLFLAVIGVGGLIAIIMAAVMLGIMNLWSWIFDR